MAEQTSENLLAMFDGAPLNARYWTTFIVMSGVLVLDFFDFFLIAFVMSVIGPEWHLTYGQGALILYGAGVGAIAGSLVSGSLGDVFGRKMQTVLGTLICGICALGERWRLSSAMCRVRWRRRLNSRLVCDSNLMILAMSFRATRCRTARRWTAFSESESPKA